MTDNEPFLCCYGVGGRMAFSLEHVGTETGFVEVETTDLQLRGLLYRIQLVETLIVKCFAILTALYQEMCVSLLLESFTEVRCEDCFDEACEGGCCADCDEACFLFLLGIRHCLSDLTVLLSHHLCN